VLIDNGGKDGTAKRMTNFQRSLNIAIFASSFHPHIGGLEEVVRQLARSYHAKGHNCIVITNQWPKTLRSRRV